MNEVTVDRSALEAKVKEMYTAVAKTPQADFHFEMGRMMAERLGYAPADLDRIPAEAIESFAGVGHIFHLARLESGERVVDLGSGSGMDTFLAALRVGPGGSVVGVDMTAAQLDKARRLARGTFDNVRFQEAYIEATGLEAGRFDCVISNGVINLAPDKARVFAEVARLLRPGGRLAMADIVTEKPLPEGVVCNADLWAACIGGAAQQDDYRTLIEAAGLRVEDLQENHEYHFTSDRARSATAKWGVKSISLLARKP
ncbi:MAG TPA: methyltransferase domain-containing protein [Polyangiaceae bacterium]|nr:methyltransferase domain-containing protein [Polyangiaceae bacterium]